MENSVGAFGVLIQYLHGFFRGEDSQFNFAPLSLTFDLIHDWKSSFARANHQATAFPRDLLFQRERRMSEGFAKLLGSFLLPFAHLASVDHHVIAVLNAIDPNLPKRELLELHSEPLIRIQPRRCVACQYCVMES